MFGRRRLSALLVLLLCPASGDAQTPDFGPSDRTALENYARATWRSFDALTLPSGLPADSLSKVAGGGYLPSYYTSPSDIAAYLWSTLAAENLGVIKHDEAVDRMGRTLGALARMERSHGFFLNWYDPRDGSTLKTWPGGGPVRPFLSTVDNGWLAASLMMVRNSRPAFRALADELLRPMDFGFFYDPFEQGNPSLHPGLLRGGFYADDSTFAGYHYGMLNTEARIASYVGIARGNLPRDHYYRMSRSRAPGISTPSCTSRGEPRVYEKVAVDEGYNSYRGMRVVPSWDGSMFEALMVTLFIPEHEWAPRGWGVNHPLYVRASIDNALHDSKLAAWGSSPSSIPGGGYKVYGVAPLSVDGRGGDPAKDNVVTPHASFLALGFAPREALANIETLATRFKAFGEHGFLDSVDLASGKVSDCELSLDQGMIMAALANALGDNSMRKAFCDGDVERLIHPLIEPEQFSSGPESVSPTAAAAPNWQAPRSQLFAYGQVALTSFQPSETLLLRRKPRD